MTDDNPQTAEVLRFRAIKAEELKRNKSLVFSSGLPNKGIYLAPTVITNQSNQQQGKIIQGCFDNANKMLELLRLNSPLGKEDEFSRSFAPTTMKINNGGAQKAPKGNLFERACSVITTITQIKPAFYYEKNNTTIIPDLMLDELMDFLDIFQRMLNDSLKENILEARIKLETTERKYTRPRIFWGNYPFAPRAAAFGAVGLLAAIGKWGQRAQQIERAKRVLESIAGDETHAGRPMYVISYDNIAQVQFTHHVVRLAISGKLSDMIGAFSYKTRLYADTDGARPNRYASANKTNYELLSLMTGRFLQLFNQSAFQDFLAIRAEYQPIVEPLFMEYFMETRMIDREIVESARALGQWLNRTAYRVADADVEGKYSEAERAKKVRQAKAKILVEFESAAMSATTPQDMMYRISTRAGRLLQMDMPPEATKFLDETLIGEKLKPKDALHLLVAYMRLRQHYEKATDDPSAKESATVADQQSNGDVVDSMITENN
jgi:hypothetical protein